MDDIIYASDGEILHLNSMPLTIDRNVSGSINFVTCQSGGNIYKQSYSYDVAGKWIGSTGWIKQ